jgi:glutathione S-transferase
MSTPIELHGKSRCPFFWRTRITAREKGIPFEALSCDVPHPDPRVAAHNPDGRSPLFWHDGFSLIESAIILQYLDEAFAGPPLQPADPQLRARMRLGVVELAGLMFDGRKPLDDQTRAKTDAALRLLDRKLADGRPYLVGDQPTLGDIEVWPWLMLLATKGGISDDTAAALPHAAAYWQRVQARESFRETTPYA